MWRMILTLSAGRIVGALQAIIAIFFVAFAYISMNELLRYAYWCFRSSSHRIKNNNSKQDGDSEKKEEPFWFESKIGNYAILSTKI